MDTKRALWVFVFITLFVTMADRLLFIIFPNYLILKNFSATEMGLIFSIASIILIVSRTYIGKASDRFGRKKILGIGLLIESVSVSFYPSISRLWEFSIVKGIKEVGETVSYSVRDALVADSFEKKIRAGVLSKLGTALPMSRALAAIVGIVITTYLSLVYGFYVAAVLIFFGFLVLFLFFKEEKTAPSKQARRTGIRYSKAFKLSTVIHFFSSLNFSVAYLPAFFLLAKSLGIMENTLFLLFLISYIISSGLTYWSGKWIDRIGRANTLAMTSLTTTVFTFMYMFANDISIFFIALLGVAASYYLWRVSFKTVLMDSTEPGIRGEQMGLNNTIGGLGDIIGPMLGGLLIDMVSLQSAFLVAGVAGLMMFCFAALVSRMRQ